VTKEFTLVDFQVCAGATSIAGEQRLLNHSLFATYEPVRLWLREHKISAPFRKIVVDLDDETVMAQWHGHVANAVGVCQVTEAVGLSLLRQKASEHRWVLTVCTHALACIEERLGWRNAALNEFVAACQEREFPLVHFFERLARVDKGSQMKCVPWLSTRPGETCVGVRIGNRDVVLVSEPGPLFMEDSFALSKSAIRGDDFVLLDKTGTVLASAPIRGGEADVRPLTSPMQVITRNIRDLEAIPLLIEFLKDPQQAGQAIIALGNLRVTEARPYIVPFLQHPDAWMRSEAERAIAKIDARTEQTESN
jgi:hypothetical protein